MLLKRYLVFRKCVCPKNNVILVEEFIWFKRGGLLSSCYWCDSKGLCNRLVVKDISGIVVSGLYSLCVSLEEKFKLDDHKYTLYAVKEVPDYS